MGSRHPVTKQLTVRKMVERNDACMRCTRLCVEAPASARPSHVAGRVKAMLLLCLQRCFVLVMVLALAWRMFHCYTQQQQASLPVCEGLQLCPAPLPITDLTSFLANRFKPPSCILGLVPGTEYDRPAIKERFWEVFHAKQLQGASDLELQTVVYAYLALVLASTARRVTSNVTVQAATNTYNIIQHNHQELAQLNDKFQAAWAHATRWKHSFGCVLHRFLNPRLLELVRSA